MFWSKNKKKIGIPLHTPVLLYISGIFHGHVFLMCIRIYANAVCWRLKRSRQVQSQKARSLKIRILCTENIGADWLCGYCTADLCLCFRIMQFVAGAHKIYVHVSIHHKNVIFN